MRLNKRGLSLIEIVISIALISVVTLFMYRLLADVTFQKDNEYFASLNQQTRAEILNYMHDNYEYSNISNVTCTDNQCKLVLSSQTMTTISLTNSGTKWYLTITDSSNKIVKNWYLYQVTGGKFNKSDEGNGKYIIRIELYTNNLENNKANNNILDDIEIMVSSIKPSSTSIIKPSSLEDSFVSIQCRENFYNTLYWTAIPELTADPSSYDFTKGEAGACDLNNVCGRGVYYDNSTIEVLKFVNKPVKIDIDNNQKIYRVHFCQFGDTNYVYGFYSKLGSFSIKDTNRMEYLNYGFAGLTYGSNGSGTCVGKGVNPCRTKFKTEYSYANGYQVEFITHFYGYKDFLNPSNQGVIDPAEYRYLEFDCDAYVDNLDETNTQYLYGERSLYTYNVENDHYTTTINKIEVQETCINSNCLNNQHQRTLDYVDKNRPNYASYGKKGYWACTVSGHPKKKFLP